jgi:hypothetical protein
VVEHLDGLAIGPALAGFFQGGGLGAVLGGH